MTPGAPNYSLARMSDDQVSLFDKSDSSQPGERVSALGKPIKKKTRKKESAGGKNSWGSLFDFSENQSETTEKVTSAGETQPEEEIPAQTKKKAEKKKASAKNAPAIGESKANEFNSSKNTTRSIQLDTDATDEEPAEESQEEHVYSVSELNKLIRGQLEGQFSFIWIQGEISNFKAHTSGHFYFSLKDEKSQINAVMFKGYNSKLKFRPETGMEVVIRGKVTVYEPRGNYQIFAEVMEPVGAGALQKAYEQLKAKLQAEGLFSQERKRPLPKLPKHIAIITSPTGAAIRDMINVLGRRYRSAQITVIPAKVQGESAAPDLVGAMKKLELLSNVDVAIIGRGGGSMEDLWAFNDETLARAIANCSVPIISAVGHEVDFTIADFVADLRAPTPSAAAELVADNVDDLKNKITNFERRLKLSFDIKLQNMRQQIKHLARQLVDPQKYLQDLMQKNDELMSRMERSILSKLKDHRQKLQYLRGLLGQPDQKLKILREKLFNFEQRSQRALKTELKRKHQELARLSSLLDSVSPLRVVDRGFSIVTKDSAVVRSTDQLKENDQIEIQFAQGKAQAEIKKILNNEKVSSDLKKES